MAPESTPPGGVELQEKPAHTNTSAAAIPTAPNLIHWAATSSARQLRQLGEEFIRQSTVQVKCALIAS
jgi:hypothetical protein